MPNSQAKDRKHLKKKLREWCNRYGRTKKQLAKYKNFISASFIEFVEDGPQ